MVILLIVGSPGFSFASALEYRTIDGLGNNVANPSWGQADQMLLRKTPQAYDDGQSTPRGGTPSLPSGRSVSNAVVSQPMGIEPIGASDMFWLWGQFLDHDMDLTTSASPAESFDIVVPSGDPFFDPLETGSQIIPLSRSIYQNDNNGVRQQLNQISAYIDASMVYGSDQFRSNALRMDGTGKLEVSPGDLLPFNTMGLDNAGGTGSNLFLAGDIRANEQISLTVMHTLFVREHNRLADEIKMRLDNGEQLITQAFTDSGLSEDDFIFQSARAVVGAEIQQITYDEFLPILLGQNALSSYSGYDDTVNVQVANEFSTAAFRVGHTMLSSTLQRINEDGTFNNPLPLKNAFFNPSIIQNDEGIDNILRGFAAGHAQRIDTFIVDDVRNFLFGPPGSGGFDLASLNIQRGRDHGIPSLNDVRLSLSLTPKTTFLEVTGSNSDLATALGSVYTGGVNDIDLWVGGLAEPPVNDGLVGETFFVLIADQLQRLRDGDRFFYLEPSMQAQLSIFDPNLQNRRLSDIILLNTEIESIQQNVFFAVARVPSDLDNDGIPDATDPDDDGDGIPDTLDTLPTTFSDDFSDSISGGTTFGHIESRGGKTVTISDLANSAGINVLTMGGGAPATVSSCGFAGIISFDSEDSVDITCGSIIINVISGPVYISYTMGASTMVATLDTGEMMTIDFDSLTITNDSDVSIIIEIDGEQITIEPDITFQLHDLPDNSQVIGGKLIPLDTIALLLAGAQSSLAWTLPLVLGSVGLAVFMLRRS